MTTLAGAAPRAGSADGTGAAARFNGPFGVAADSAGNVYVADQLNHTIRKITADGVVTTLAGAAGMPGSVDGVGAAARFAGPDGMAVDGAGNVYVADQANYTIRKVTAGGVVTTLAGTAGTAGSTDGTGSAARFCRPDRRGGRQRRQRLRRRHVQPHDPQDHARGIVTTLAGTAGLPGPRTAPAPQRGSPTRRRCGRQRRQCLRRRYLQPDDSQDHARRDRDHAGRPPR